MKYAIVTLSILSCLSAGSESGRQMVRLVISATDSARNPVTDLHISDIQVRDSGKSLSPLFFQYAGSRSTAGPATVILLDRWNEHMQTVAVASSELRDALHHFDSLDRVYLYILTTRGEILPVRALPAARAGLPAAARPTLAELTAQLDSALPTIEGFRYVDALDTVSRTDVTLQTLQALMQSLPAAEAKNLIWITSGFPAEFRDTNGKLVDFTPRIRLVSQAAVAARVSLYPVTPSAEVDRGILSLNPRTLQMFAERTGGRWHPTNGVSEAIRASLADAAGAYRLAYYSTARAGDEKIRVSSSRPGVRISVRSVNIGHDSPTDTAEIARAAFDSGSRSPFDAVEIPVRAELAHDRVAVRIDPAGVFINRTGEQRQVNLVLSYAVYRNGILRSQSTPANLDLVLKSEPRDGIVMQQSIPLPQDIDHVRVMIFDRTLHTMGSVTLPR